MERSRYVELQEYKPKRRRKYRITSRFWLLVATVIVLAAVVYSLLTAEFTSVYWRGGM